MCRACRDGSSAICARAGVYGVDQPGGLADHVAVNHANVYAVDERTPPGTEVLAEPLAVAGRAVRRAGLQQSARVAVFGGGAIGVLVTLVARSRHAADVVVIEPDTRRAALLRALGIDVIDVRDDVADAVRDHFSGQTDVTIEASGQPAAVPPLTRVTRSGGTIAVVGVHAQPALLNLRAVCLREQTVLGSCMYDDEDFLGALGLLAGNDLGLERLPIETVPFTDAPEMFHRLAAGTSAAVKSVIVLDRAAV